MAIQPAYLRALKDYAKIQFGDDALMEKVRADLTNESDRGAVILASTGIEDILEWALMQRMPFLARDASARKAVFGVNGVCGTFSEKIHLAYALGIIDKGRRAQIDLIREIRNACAHCRLPLSFEEAALQGAVKVVIEEMLPSLKNQEPATLRMAFIVMTSTIQQGVALGRRVSVEESFRLAQEMEKAGEF